MSGKPYRSILIPYEEEILALRHRRPPMSYAQIAAVLLEKYQLNICRETIFKFIKVRSRGRKVYGYSRQGPATNVAPAKAQRLAASDTRPTSTTPPMTERRPPRKFDFMPSDRYCLTRLPPEEAAAIRKKLEEEGH